jgi:hypothetical protein
MLTFVDCARTRRARSFADEMWKADWPLFVNEIRILAITAI